MKQIDPFYFTLLRYLAVSLILVTLLIIAEGTKALSLEGKAKWVWLLGSMDFTVYNFLVFLGQKAAGPSGAVLASIMMALMPTTSVLVMCVYKKTAPSKVTLGCILVAFLGVSLVITKGDISLLSSTSGNLIPALLILTGVFGWVIYTAGGSHFKWSPLRYAPLSCVLGTASTLVIVVLATIAGYLKVPDVDTVATIRWEMGHMIVISGVLAIFSWRSSPSRRWCRTTSTSASSSAPRAQHRQACWRQMARRNKAVYGHGNHHGRRFRVRNRVVQQALRGQLSRSVGWQGACRHGPHILDQAALTSIILEKRIGDPIKVIVNP